METMNTTFEESIKSFKGYTHLNIQMTSPLVLTCGIELKPLSVITGVNASGKSLILKLTWVANFFSTFIIADRCENGETSNEYHVETLQYMLDNSFIAQDFSGTFCFSVRDDILSYALQSLSFDIECGVVTDVLVNIAPTVVEGINATFLSTYARDFSNITMYMKTKKQLGISEVDYEAIKQLGYMYMIYDITFMELLLFKLRDPLTVGKIKGSTLNEIEGLERMISVVVDDSICGIYFINDDGNKQLFSTLGKGSQSLFVMMITTL